MKLLYRFFIAAFCVLMVSCSDEPDGPEPPETTDYPDCTVSDVQPSAIAY